MWAMGGVDGREADKRLGGREAASGWERGDV